MQNNNPNNYLQEDEIDLKEIFKFLINSKKLFIAITLVITTLGAIYTFQKVPEYKSTALIEIGGYNTFSNEEGLIEPGKDLIQDLKINFIYKSSVDALIFRLIEKKLLQIEYISPSAEKNNNLLNEIVEYIVNRHSLLLSNNTQKTENQIESLNNQIEFRKKTIFTQNEADKLRISNQIESLNNQIEAVKLRISNQIESLNNQIEFRKKTIFTQNEADKLRISDQIESLNNELPITDLKINALNKVIIEDEDNLKLLASNPDLFLQRAAQSPTLNQVIFSYNNQLIDLEAEKIYLSQEKDSLEWALKLLESRDSESNEIFNLSQEKDSLELELKLLESRDSESDDIFNLSQEKDALELELKLLESRDSESDDIFNLSQEKNLTQEKDSLELELKLLESKDLESNTIFNLSQKKDDLELELKFLMNQNLTSTQLVREILINEVATNKALHILLSFIFGLLLSSVVIFINNSLKASKEEQA